MVLHDRKHDLVARLDTCADPCSDDVDGLGTAFGEDDLLDRLCIDKTTHGLARALISLRRLVRERMQAAMHVRVAVAHRAGHRVDHRIRLLRGGSVVEIDQRLAVDRPAKDGKLLADGADVERHDATPNHTSIRASISARRASPIQSGSASIRKARVIIARASASGMPRWRR